MPINKMAVTYAISKFPQASYGALEPNAVYVPLITTGRTFAKLSPSIANDADYAHGFETATEQWVDDWDTERTLEIALSAEQLGRLLTGALGGGVTAAISGATPNTAKTHTFESGDVIAAPQLPVFTLIEFLGNGRKRVLPGMVVKKLTIKSDKGRLTASVTFKGSGKILLNPGGGYAVINDEPWRVQDMHYWRYANGVLVVTGNAFSPACQLETWTLDIENQLDEAAGYRSCASYQDSANADSGQIRSEMLLLGQAFKFGYDSRTENSDPQEAALLAQAPQNLSLTLTGKSFGTYSGGGAMNYKAEFTAPRCYYEAADPSAENFVKHSSSLNLLADPLNGDPALTCVLTNNIASYNS